MVSILALLAVSLGYLQHARRRSAVVSAAATATVAATAPATGPSPSGAGPTRSGGAAGEDSTVASPGDLVFIDTTPGPHYGSLSTVPLADPSAAPTLLDLACLRTYAVPGRVLCLRATDNPLRQFEALVLDSSLRPIHRFPLAGLPSRARLSRDGRIASWTVFVRGDSYLSSGFSTRTSILDIRTGALIGSLESFAVTMDGRRYRSADLNFWGVTMTADDNTFYATMASKGSTHLVRGDLRARTVRTLVSNVECPSLSPDDTRLVFKRRAPQGADGRVPWRLHVLDLATMKQTELAETRSVDDQAAWLDGGTIAYALPRSDLDSYDLWTVAADGSGSPRRLVEHASSPAPVASP